MPSLEPLRLLVVAVLALSACTSPSGGPSGVEPRPIEEILDSGIVVTPDPSGTSATLSVTTSVPVACAVVYGVDEGLGSLATDDDMAGGAHVDHSPVLGGLEPETEYRYVLQGSDVEGNWYRSEPRTFTTPPTSEAERPGPNVATTATVADVSSEFSDGFAAGLAVDGDPLTEWASAGDGDGAWIELELPEPTAVVGFALRSRSMGDGSAVIERYRVLVDDGEPLGPFEAGTRPAVVDVDVTGRTFRFEAVDTTGGNTGAGEIEILARP